MWISRVRVTGGFLNGLDVSLSQGLNVVIGPRGAGKTTLLELIRHALGAKHPDQGEYQKTQEFLAAILGAGEVKVDVETDEGGRLLLVDAKGGGQRTDMSSSVLVLGQNELEGIASDALSRLRLLDLRMGAAIAAPERDEAGSLTGSIWDIKEQLENRREESAKRDSLSTERDLLGSQEAALLGGESGHLTELREQLRLAEEQVIQTNFDIERINSILEELMVASEAQEEQTDLITDIVNRAEGLSQSFDARETLAHALNLSREINELITQSNLKLLEATESARSANLEARGLAAPIRETLERAETGLGQITAELRNVNSELRSLDENDALISELEQRLADLSARRSQILDDAEAVEETLFNSRAQVARETTAQIANNVVVEVNHLADFSEFREFLQDSLRGTSTRAAMIDLIAERALPRQLLDVVEAQDVKALAAVLKISTDRAQRLIENLNRKNILQELARIRLTDSADFRLHDGAVDKSVDLLSTGQKCAVTLPIVLSEKERTLILDQPEDHLDNAYLVKNIISGLINRRLEGAQTIIATHNANIPVLGSADKVIVLSSDGVVGSVESIGAFDESEIVDSITGLMEGGREAFARRSAFYAEHGGLE
jgi:ABC-type Mn2+/Zn2+ transport system ATPase subunit